MPSSQGSSTMDERYRRGLILGTDAQYEREATAKLINLFCQSCIVKVIYFNDPKIHRVMRRFRHDNHFHVTIVE